MHRCSSTRMGPSCPPAGRPRSSPSPPASARPAADPRALADRGERLLGELGLAGRGEDRGELEPRAVVRRLEAEALRGAGEIGFGDRHRAVITRR